MVLWRGDILTPLGQHKIEQAARFADRILMSYRGIHEKLAVRYGRQLLHLPFAASPRFHSRVL